MTTWWCDYSYARPNIAGYAGVMRYLNAGTSRPDLTRAEVDTLHAQGKPVGLIWQASKTEALSGTAGGANAVQRANAEADKLGAPAGVAIFYTVDGDYTPTQVEPYVRALLATPGRPVGLYGPRAVIDWAESVGVAWRWQAAGWSGGAVSPAAHLVQSLYTPDLDRDELLAPFPAWAAEGVSMGRIIPRAEWGFDGWLNGVAPPTVPLAARTEFFIHYEGGAPVGNQVGPPVPQSIHAYHKNGNGWAGIGYNFVVDQQGNTFEGRGWDMVGAHCPNHNVSGIGVQVHIGGVEQPSAAAKTAARALYDQLVAMTGRPIAKRGHRDGFPTACPGDPLYGWVLAGMPAAVAPAPAPTPPPPPPLEEDDMFLFRAKTGAVCVSTPTGVRGLDPRHLANLEALGVKYGPPGADEATFRQLDEGPFGSLVESLGGVVENFNTTPGP